MVGLLNEGAKSTYPFTMQLSIVSWIFGWFIAYYSLHKVILNPLAKSNFTETNDSRRGKFASSCWKFISYRTIHEMFFFYLISTVSLVMFALWSIKNEGHWFWDSSKWHDPYHNNTIPSNIRSLYFLEISYYFFSLASMYHEPVMKDFWIMTGHHLFTLILLISSYLFGASKYGTVIMLLHDVSDPLMEAAKISLYLGSEWLANILFGVFAISFVILRDIVYPLYVVVPTKRLLIHNEYRFYGVTMGCLVGLWFLHLFWTVLIVKVAIKAISGHQEGDIREKDG